jgi:hypothetical protein
MARGHGRALQLREILGRAAEAFGIGGADTLADFRIAEGVKVELRQEGLLALGAAHHLHQLGGHRLQLVADGFGWRPGRGEGEALGAHRRQQQLGLAGEVRVDRALGHAGPGGDLVEAGAREPLRRHHLQRRRHQRRAGSLTLATSTGARLVRA